MYEEQRMAKEYAIASGQQRVDFNPTVEENIDSRIKYLQAEIDRLKKSKDDLAPLLKMRIRDIRSAMDY
jgi:hypothetical protein